MTKLKKYKFSDLYEMSSGISSKPEQAGHGAPFVSFSTVFNNQFLPGLLPDLMDTSSKEKVTYSIKDGDIFLTRTSETLDELGMSSVSIKDYPDASYSGFLKRLRPKQTNVTYGKFMAFYLRSKLFRKTMNNNAIMTLRASLNEQIFSYLDLILPKYDEQVKIGDLFYAFNQKIELNNKTNTDLEAMAKLIYDYWFVQFDFPDENGKPYKTSGGIMVYNEELKREIPSGWEIERLNSLLDYNSGHSFSSKSYCDSGKWKIVTIKSVQENGFDTSKCDRIKSIPQNLDAECNLEIGDLLMSLTGNTGRLCFVTESNCLLNQRVAKIWGSKLSNYFIYLYFKRPEKQKLIEQLSSGSSQANLSPLQLFKIKDLIPENTILKSFEDKIEPIFQKILVNEKENQKLAELRDWLLPMLMNGQVRVTTRE